MAGSPIRIRVNGSAQTIAAGSTLEGLASILWEAASLDVVLFVVADTTVDKRGWAGYVLSDGDGIVALGAPVRHGTYAKES